MPKKGAKLGDSSLPGPADAILSNSSESSLQLCRGRKGVVTVLCLPSLGRAMGGVGSLSWKAECRIIDDATDG